MLSNTSRCSTFWSRRQQRICTAAATKLLTGFSAMLPPCWLVLLDTWSSTFSQTEPERGLSTEKTSPSPVSAAISAQDRSVAARVNCSVATLDSVAVSLSISSARGNAAAQWATSSVKSPKTRWLKGQISASLAPAGTLAPLMSRARHQPRTSGSTRARQPQIPEVPSPGVGAMRAMMAPAPPSSAPALWPPVRPFASPPPPQLVDEAPHSAPEPFQSSLAQSVPSQPQWLQPPSPTEAKSSSSSWSGCASSSLPAPSYN
mmetsp:Transcript_21159/g.59205  ORF Transcript_21159/g.59205 Transcript_21159/m.59205 type:complete len:260 (+) Transcript_21159:300-1079(+)